MKIHNHPKSIVKRVLIALLVFILSFSAVSMLVTIIFYQTAYPRKDTPSVFSYSYSEMEAKGYPSRRIEFTSGENTLTGYYYAPDDPEAIVVIAAGFGDSGASHLSVMMRFVDEGFSVFCYDAAGVGESEGKSLGGLSQPALDMRSALDYISDDPSMNELPILLYGHSAGGYAAAVCTDSPGVKAAVLLCPFESPTRLMRVSARSYIGVIADIEYPFLLLENNILYTSELNQSASACVARSPVPVAVYEGAHDQTIPAAERLSAHLDFDEDDATLRVCSTAPHSGHYGIWLSEDAIRYRKSFKNDAVPDRDAANELDPAFITQVISFFQNSL